MERILLIGVSEYIRKSAVSSLSRAGFSVIWESPDNNSLKKVSTYLPDLVILDEQLDSPNSMALCSQIQLTSRIPLIVIVNNPENMSRYLYYGADACLLPTDSERLLITRIRSLFRRYRINNNFLPAGIHLDPETWQISFSGPPIQFTPTEYLFLTYLIRRCGSVVPYSDLLLNVWGSCDVSQGSIKFYLSSVRKKLYSQTQLANLINCRGIGLRLDYNDKFNLEQLNTN